MKQDLHKFDATFKTMMKETGYKHLAMEDPQGSRIVSYNQPKTKIETKFEEIRKRLNVLPDGIYKILAQYNYGSKSAPDIFLIKKGNAVLSEDNETVKNNTIQVKQQSKQEKEYDNVMSLPEALKRIEELAKLNVEVESLRDKVKTQAEYISELEADLDEVENADPALSEGTNPNSAMAWAEKTLPTITPFLEEYFKVKNRSLDIQEKRLNQAKEKKKPIIVSTGKNRRPNSQQKSFMEINMNDDKELDDLFNKMEALNDEQFDNVFSVIERDRPELADLIAEEFGMNEEEGESNENTGGAE
jgi:hypothetical protein